MCPDRQLKHQLLSISSCLERSWSFRVLCLWHNFRISSVPSHGILLPVLSFPVSCFRFCVSYCPIIISSCTFAVIALTQINNLKIELLYHFIRSSIFSFYVLSPASGPVSAVFPPCLLYCSVFCFRFCITQLSCLPSFPDDVLSWLSFLFLSKIIY